MTPGLRLGSPLQVAQDDGRPLLERQLQQGLQQSLATGEVVADVGDGRLGGEPRDWHGARSR